MSEDEIALLEIFKQLTPKNKAALLDCVKAVYAAEKKGSALPGPPLEGGNG
jgi:hypothetical protein